METGNPERKKFVRSVIPPSFLIIFLWMIKIFENAGSFSLGHFGILPRELSGMMGIVFSPLLHADFIHLTNNSVPLLILTVALNYFYPRIALRIFLLIWFVTGLCVWIGGRESYHIGASGVIYGLASFLFFSGVFRKNIRLLAISLLVIFLYGSMVWGIFPVFPDISWESHLFGFLSGLTFASIYYNEGETENKPDFSDDPDDAFPYWEVNEEDENIKKTL